MEKKAEHRTSATPEADYDKLGRDALIALLRSALQQRDEVISKYEAMAYQVDESTREIDDAVLAARREAAQAEKNERHAEEEEAIVAKLERLLDAERGKNAALAADFARYREQMAKTPVEDPWGHLWRALSQIGADGVAWMRAKIPPDSKMLPWFDRVVEGVETAGRTACQWGVAAYDWAKPRAIELYQWGKPRAIEGYRWARGEIERRMGKGPGTSGP
ncbi:hypothetical protein [Methylosinus sp. Sm6]|uniref:hypothetical protein n=1 Tax=Methylosinus sp. Sm6 TaxID=2866948 RepID=UPI001C996D1F|nr:hypothetical protein [Methylosinus sp. Sm6]MBY6242739.1 hypothetical protein [Methylosinus sp. Sm6]